MQRKLPASPMRITIELEMSTLIVCPELDYVCVVMTLSGQCFTLTMLEMMEVLERIATRNKAIPDYR
jgi:hypothetical protein